MNYLLDTNVISETIKPRKNKKVIDWLSSVDNDDLFISVLTLGEIKRGIEKLNIGQKKHKLVNWLQSDLTEWFNGKILSIDENVALKWGKITSAHGNNFSAIDSLIAATAITNDLVLVTRNIKDFKNIKTIELFNPWG